MNHFTIVGIALTLSLCSLNALAGAFSLSSSAQDEVTCLAYINQEFSKNYEPKGCTITNPIIDFRGRFNVTCVAVVSCKD